MSHTSIHLIGLAISCHITCAVGEDYYWGYIALFILEYLEINSASSESFILQVRVNYRGKDAKLQLSLKAKYTFKYCYQPTCIKEKKRKKERAIEMWNTCNVWSHYRGCCIRCHLIMYIQEFHYNNFLHKLATSLNKKFHLLRKNVQQVRIEVYKASKECNPEG